MKTFLKKAILSAAILVGSTTGCKNYENLSEQKLKERGFTQEQAEVLTAVSFRYMLTDQTKSHDGTAAYAINYGAITEEEILTTVERTYKDLTEILETTNVSEAKYLSTTGLGEHLKKQEEVYKYLDDTLKRKVLHRKFKNMIRENGGQIMNSYDPYKISDEEKYSIATLFPFKKENLEFNARYVDVAKETGKLKDPATIVEEINTQQKYFEKIKNPDYPLKDRNNEWVHKERNIGIRIISYNLDNDTEKIADYIEAYRLNTDGEQESLPAIRVFKPNGAGNLEVVVADRDLEGERGYGTPDYLTRSLNIFTAYDILSSEAADYIFNTKEERAPPDLESANTLYIARAGTITKETYDIDKSGWESYLPDYKSGKNTKNFMIHIKLKETSSIEEGFKGEVEWIAKQYYDKSRVVEFYNLNSKFKDASIVSGMPGKIVPMISGKTVSMVDSTGQIKQYYVDAVVDPFPYRIDFDRNPQKRWVLLDQDDDKNHYEAKKEVTWTEDIIPK